LPVFFAGQNELLLVLHGMTDRHMDFS